MAGKLARLNWQMGQTLLPMHFIAQEDSLLNDIHVRFRMGGLPFFGVGKLRWNDSLLSQGILSIVQITIILPTGQILDVPENATINTFNMNFVGNTKVPIYLHFLGETEVENIPQKEEDNFVNRRNLSLELSSDLNNSKSLESLKLAEFIKDPEGTWGLSNDYLPPLIQVGTSPFLKEPLQWLSQALELFHYKLTQEIAATYLSGENLFNAKQCLLGVYRLQRFLANLSKETHFHPYYVYESLKVFYTELCLYQNRTPENIANPYIHDQLALCFKEIFDPLLAQIQSMKGKTPYLAFTKKDGVFVLNDLPREASRAKEVYFLIQKSRVGDQISIDGLKLSSFSRLSVVHQLALHGVPYQKLDSPPFQHPFGAEVDFYLVQEGEEWDNVLTEGAIAFYEQPGFEAISAYLYWRQG